MAVKEEREKEGFDSEKLTRLQELMTRLVHWQVLAVALPCPSCKGKLERKDIQQVVCTQCGLPFNCQALVESQTLALDK
jgi:hypothetical protein